MKKNKHDEQTDRLSLEVILLNITADFVQHSVSLNVHPVCYAAAWGHCDKTAVQKSSCLLSTLTPTS